MIRAYVDERVSIRKLAQRFHRDQASISKVIRAAGVHGSLFQKVMRGRRGRTYESLVTRVGGLGSRPTPMQWAYIAGIFDGEGCLEISHGRCRVSIAQKDHALHRYLQQTLGCGAVQQNGHCAHFRLTGQKRVLEFLCGVVAHLVVKRARTEMAIELLQTRYPSLRGVA